MLLGGDQTVFPSDLSPDGRYLLYYAGRQGSSSSYLTRYPEIAGRWKVSTGTDVSAETFAPDGSAIYYTSEDALYRVSLEDGPTPVLGRPERMGDLPDGSGGDIQIHPDNDSYLIAVNSSAPGSGNRRGIKVVQHWTAKLDRR